MRDGLAQEALSPPQQRCLTAASPHHQENCPGTVVRAPAPHRAARLPCAGILFPATRDSLLGACVKVIVRYSIPSMTPEQYDEATIQIEAIGREWPPRGLEYHAAFRSDESLLVVEVWSSRKQLHEYGQWLLPLLANVGVDVDVAETDVSEIHNIITP
jgi:hypothetical protein